MDDLDRAQVVAQEHLDDALAHHRRVVAASAPHHGPCIDCGEEIDPERIAALGSPDRCCPCQAEHERTLRRGGLRFVG